ncbi:MAG: hypothetical protein M1820_008002 [Bogoriella megaspora]|nr:MAG: hypothetical protein M1820_008002 [Bogoriella megaspora]
MLALYACGSDSLGQITGRKNTQRKIDNFKLIARQYRLRVLSSSFGRTVYADDKDVYCIGVPTDSRTPLQSHQIKEVFSTDEDGITGLITVSGELYSRSPVTTHRNPQTLSHFNLRTRNDATESSYNPEIQHFAIAGNGRASATYFRRVSDVTSAVLVTGTTWQGLVHDTQTSETFGNVVRFLRPSQPKQLVANSITFTMLMHDGMVYTWGDPRYGALGRQQDEGFDVPCPLRALEGLKVVKVAAGGFFSAALTEDGRLYVWGVARPGGEQVDIVEGSVGLQSIAGNGEDRVVDVAVGDNHIVALLADGRIFGVGEGQSGELGAAVKESGGFARTWVEIPTPGLERVNSLVCGRQSTFLLCETQRLDVVVPEGDAIQILTQEDDSDSWPKKIREDAESQDTNLRAEEVVGSEFDDSDLPLEGPDDWFRGTG